MWKTNAGPESPAMSEYPYGMAKIAFERDGVVYLYNLQTKTQRRIADGFEPDISPDGNAIAFTRRKEDSLSDSAITIVTLKTNKFVEIPSLDGFHTRSPRWSHEGTRLAFDVVVDRRTHVGILDVLKGEWHDVTKSSIFDQQTGIYFSSWAPDDRSALCHDLSSVYELSLDGNILTTLPINKLVDSGEVGSDLKFQFSRDKKLLLFTGTRNPEFTIMYLFNMSEHTKRRLTSEGVDAFDPVWLPSQNEIMFSLGHNDSSNFTSDLCVMSVSDGKVSTILPNASSGSYSTR